MLNSKRKAGLSLASKNMLKGRLENAQRVEKLRAQEKWGGGASLKYYNEKWAKPPELLLKRAMC